MWTKKDPILALIKKAEKFQNNEPSLSRADELRAALDRKIKEAA